MKSVCSVRCVNTHMIMMPPASILLITLAGVVDPMLISEYTCNIMYMHTIKT